MRPIFCSRFAPSKRGWVETANGALPTTETPRYEIPPLHPARTCNRARVCRRAVVRRRPGRQSAERQGIELSLLGGPGRAETVRLVDRVTTLHRVGKAVAQERTAERRLGALLGSVHAGAGATHRRGEEHPRAIAARVFQRPLEARS